MVFPKKNSDWDYPERGRGAPSPTRSSGENGSAERWSGRRAANGAAKIDPLSGDTRKEDPAALAERVVFKLWADGLVNARSIEQARREVEGRLRLDQALARLNLVDGAAVAAALASELGLPLVRDDEFPREPVAADMLPERFVSEALAVPLADDGRSMRLALADPIDDFALRAIAMKTKRRLEICVASPEQLETAIARLYKGVDRPRAEPRARRRAEADAGGGVLALTGAQRTADAPEESFSEEAFSQDGFSEDRFPEDRFPDEPLSGAALREEPRLENSRREDTRRHEARRDHETPRDDAPRQPALDNRINGFAPAPRRFTKSLPLEEPQSQGGVTPRFVRPRRVTVKDRVTTPPIRPGLENAAPNGSAFERRGGAKRRLDRLREEVSARLAEPASAERPQSPSKRRFVTGFVTGVMNEFGGGGARAVAPRRHDPLAADAQSVEPGFSESPTSVDAAVEALGKTLDRPLDDPFAPREEARPEARPAGRDAGAESAEIERRALMSARGRTRNSAARRLVMTELRRTLRGEAPPEPAEAPKRAPSATAGRSIYQAARAVEQRESSAGPEVGSLVRHTLISEPAPAPSRRETPEQPAAASNGASNGRSHGVRDGVRDGARQGARPERARAAETAVEADLEALAFNAEARAALEQAVAGGEGLILVCGPSGSGKADTSKALAAMAAASGATLRRFDRGEDVRAKADPEAPPVAFTGEIRDAESAEAAARAAMTGHLVVATLDAPSAAAAAPRLYDMGVPPYVLASSLRAVVAQHLAPRICPRCAESGAADCDACDGDGVAGSVAIVEWMLLDDTIRALILAQAPAAAFRHAMSATQTPSLADDAAEKVSAGLVREADAARAASASAVA